MSMGAAAGITVSTSDGLTDDDCYYVDSKAARTGPTSQGRSCPVVESAAVSRLIQFVAWSPATVPQNQ